MSDPRESTDRYDRQTRFAPLGHDGQDALSRGSVVVVGVGGVGSWTAQLLVRAGVGRVRLVDADDVAFRDLHRQCLYRADDAREGVAKVRASARALCEINPEPSIEPVVARLDADNAPDLLDDADVVCDGTDNFAARYAINDRCVKTRTPWVFAGAAGAGGQVMPILPGGPCLRCIHPSAPPAERELTAATVGVLGPVVATIGAMSAGLAMHVLASPGTVPRQLLSLDLWTGQVRRLSTGPDTRDATCRTCAGRPEAGDR
jgi:adenylyltransferase/sulfurtransferase